MLEKVLVHVAATNNPNKPPFICIWIIAPSAVYAKRYTEREMERERERERERHGR
jgi:hypothetical protein